MLGQELTANSLGWGMDVEQARQVSSYVASVDVTKADVASADAASSSYKRSFCLCSCPKELSSQVT